MILIIGFVFVLLLVASPEFRVLCKHPFKSAYWAVIDVYRYFHDKQYNIYQAGKIIAYCAYFGGGKTLSMVDYVLLVFKRYNNKRYYDRRKGKWVTQIFHFISNVDIKNVPENQIEKLNTLGQIVRFAETSAKIDKELDTRTVCITVIDEASAELNSRSFKENGLSGSFLSTLTTVRHASIDIIYSSQEFTLADKLLRDVTKRVIWCEKTWRFLVQKSYSAKEVENANGDVSLLKPLKTVGIFVEDKLYNSYDTLANVESLAKKWRDGDLLTEQEILELRGQSISNTDMITPSKKFIKRKKKLK